MFRSSWLALVGLVTLAVAACGSSSADIDAAPAADAPPIVYTCLTQPDAGSAPATISVTGTVKQGLTTMSASSGAVVKFFQTDETTVIDSFTTGADGNYTISLPTGGLPLAAVGQFSHATDSTGTFVNEWVYTGEPIYADLANLDGLLLDTAELQSPLVTAYFGSSWDNTKSVAVVLAVDCNGTIAQGAQITISPAPASVVYADADGLPDHSLTQTSASGVVYVWNIPIGASKTATVSGTVGSMALRTHPFGVHPGEISLTLIRP